MALLGRFLASFQAATPVPSLTPLDGEFNQLTGANGALNGGSTSVRLLTKYNHATEPVSELDQLGAGAIQQWKQNGTLKASIGNNGQFVSAVVTGTAPLSIASTTLVPNLNADTVDGIDGANIAKLNTNVTAWSISFPITDPSTPTLAAILGGVFVTPDGTAITLTKIKVVSQSGSHTAGGSVEFAIAWRTAATTWSGVTNLGGTLLNNTNNSTLVVYTNDIGDVSLSPGDTLGVFINARSGTITERDVSVVCMGTQRLT